jgi:flavin reductase (DIM6/NTAB) family NADH-FMN oxidoreductase RutF
MVTYYAADMSPAKWQGFLTGAIGPRPIAFASTVNADGVPNLSPFSFFNVFSSNPPVLVFSPARRVRDNTTKHTLENVLVVPEVVVNIVNYDMVQQASLASTEYPEGVNEFVKAGFTELASEKIKPPRVKESPVQFECRVTDTIPLGKEGGAGVLVLCEVLVMHIHESVLHDGRIDQNKIKLVGRLGANWYSKGFDDALFEVAKPLTTLGIGIDQLPPSIRLSTVLTGNHLGQLGNVEHLPDAASTLHYAQEMRLEDALRGMNPTEKQTLQHKMAAHLLEHGKVEEAWKLLLFPIEKT